MYDDTEYISIDHILGSFDENVSPIGKINSIVFDPCLFNEQRMPVLELLGVEPISGKIAINLRSGTH